MKALVISGGGSKGAFAGGFVQHLIQDLKIEYDMFVGTSTGSLLVPHISIGRIDKMKHIYTNVCQDDIYNVCPFRLKMGKDGKMHTSINHFNTLKMFLKRRRTFGEHENLRKTIERTFSFEEFNQVKNSGKHVIVTVSNLSTRKVEYKYAADATYEDFCDWMWASTSFVPFMSIVEKNGYEYADGGFGNYIPIEEAVNMGAKEIDVIVLNPRHQTIQRGLSLNAFDVLLQSMQFMHHQLGKHDILIGHLESIYNDDVKVRFHFTPRVLTEYSFFFDPVEMKEWWDEGYEFAKKRFADYSPSSV